MKEKEYLIYKLVFPNDASLIKVLLEMSKVKSGGKFGVGMGWRIQSQFVARDLSTDFSLDTLVDKKTHKYLIFRVSDMDKFKVLQLESPKSK